MLKNKEPKQKSIKTITPKVEESIKLKDLIAKVKDCQTLEDERKLITQECSNIRQTMNDPNFKTRNVMKLIYLDLLGYNTQFG